MNSVPFQYADDRGEIHHHKVTDESTFEVEFASGKKETISYEKFIALKNPPTTKSKKKIDRVVKVHGVKE